MSCSRAATPDTSLLTQPTALWAVRATDSGTCQCQPASVRSQLLNNITEATLVVCSSQPACKARSRTHQLSSTVCPARASPPQLEQERRTYLSARCVFLATSGLAAPALPAPQVSCCCYLSSHPSVLSFPICRELF